MATNSAAHLFRKSLADQILSQRLQNQRPRGFKLMNLIRVLTLMKPRLKITCQEIRFIQHHTTSYNIIQWPYIAIWHISSAWRNSDRRWQKYSTLHRPLCSGYRDEMLRTLTYLTYLTSRLRDWIKLVSLVSGIPPWPSVTLNLTAVPCVSCRFHPPPPFSVFQGRLWTLNGGHSHYSMATLQLSKWFCDCSSVLSARHCCQVAAVILRRLQTLLWSGSDPIWPSDFSQI